MMRLGPCFVWLAILLGACAKDAPVRRLPAPEPYDRESSALGLAVHLSDDEGNLRFPEMVYFARLDPGSSSLLQPDVVRSNHADDGCFFLFNASPGDYVVVAATETLPVEGLAGRVSGVSDRNQDDDTSELGIEFGKRKRLKHRIYFSRDLAKTSRTTLARGAFAYMGTVTVETDRITRGADDVQAHYRRILEGVPGMSVGDPATAPVASLGNLGSFQKEGEAETEFWGAARTALGKSTWMQRAPSR